MDLKTHIVRWERLIEDNNAIALLAIIIGIAVLFIVALIVDAILKRRRDKRHHRR